MVNYIRLVYCKEDIIPYVKIKLFLEWIGFRTYEYKLETSEDMDDILDGKDSKMWEKERTIFLYHSQMKERLKMELEKGEQDERSFVILTKETEDFLKNSDSVIYYISEEELSYTHILKKILPVPVDAGMKCLIDNYNMDMIRSMYTISQIYANSKLVYKKSELLEDAEKSIIKAIKSLEKFEQENKSLLEDNVRFFYAVNYLKDLQNVKRKLFQEDMAWSSYEMVDSLNKLLEKESDFKSCYLLKVSICEKQAVTKLSELLIFNLESAQDRLDYIAQYKLGVFYQNKKQDKEKALEQYNKCFVTNPSYYRNLYKLALYYKGNEDYELALEYFSKILNVTKEKEVRYWETEEFEYYFKTQYFMARIYWETKEYLKANLAYQKAFEIWSNLKKSNIVKKLYEGKEDNIVLFMKNKYLFEQKRKSIINETGLPLKAPEW